MILWSKAQSADYLGVSRVTVDRWLAAGVLRPAHRNRHLRHDAAGPDIRAADLLISDDVIAVGREIAGLPHDGGHHAELSSAARTAAEAAIAARVEAIRRSDGSLPATTHQHDNPTTRWSTTDCPSCGSEILTGEGLFAGPGTDVAGTASCEFCSAPLTILRLGVGNVARIRS